jgi:class 3 adenylate cyclase
MFTDIVGSTDLMHALRARNVWTFYISHFKLLESVINEEGGTVVKSLGDGVLATFKLPTQALKAALRIQDKMIQGAFLQTPGAYHELWGPLQIRIGISQGLVLGLPFAGLKDITGEPVVKAQRVMSECPPGAVLLTEDVHGAVAQFLDDVGQPQHDSVKIGATQFKFRRFGLVELKGFEGREQLFEAFEAASSGLGHLWTKPLGRLASKVVGTARSKVRSVTALGLVLGAAVAVLVSGLWNHYAQPRFPETFTIGPRQVSPLEASRGRVDLVLTVGERQSMPDTVAAVARCDDGSFVTCGTFSGDARFEGSNSLPRRKSQGSEDVFVCRYGPGGSIDWVWTLGGVKQEQATALAVTPDAVYVAGCSASTRMTAHPALGIDLESPPFEGLGLVQNAQGFVCRIGLAGTTEWVQCFAGDNRCEVLAMAAEPRELGGDLFVAGRFAGTCAFPFDDSTARLSSRGDYDGFVVRLKASDGTRRGAVGQFGGIGNDSVTCISTASDHGGPVVGGMFSSRWGRYGGNDSPEWLCPEAPKSGGYVMRLMSNLERSEWGASFFDQYDGGNVTGVSVDGNGQVYAVGYGGRELTARSERWTHTVSGGRGTKIGFLWKATERGATVYFHQFDGGTSCEPLGVHASAGLVAIFGRFAGELDLDPGPLVLRNSIGGNQCLFEVLDASNGTLRYQYQSSANIAGIQLEDRTGRAILVGSFLRTLRLDSTKDGGPKTVDGGQGQEGVVMRLLPPVSR